MKVGTPGFVGERLTEARQARGLTAVSLAEILGVTPQSISQYEKNKQSPSPEIMQIISERLHFPRERFLLALPSRDDAPVFWRSNVTAVKHARERAEIRLAWIKEILDYQSKFFDFPSLNLPKVDVPDDFRKIDTRFLDKLALLVRDHWDIGAGPMPDLLLEMENNGIVVSRINVDAEKLDAFSQWSLESNVPFVVLGREKASAVRQRFDAAHELLHLLAHRNVDKKRINSAQDFKILEDQAHYFASSLLLPEKQFVDELYGCSLDSFLALKERWRVSIGAMIMRSKSLGLISASETQRLWINHTRRGWRQAEPLDNKLEKERPRLLRRSMESLLAERVQSAAQIVSSLSLPAEDIEELCDLDEGVLSGKRPEQKAMPVLKGSASIVADKGTNVLAFGVPKRKN
jgi:Zn-dependent peptidase ImmA (M78 family)/transcriptional regulator with XRE-family HTH domain